jgi:hypothetical protein
LVVENLQSLLSLPPMPGVAAVHGSGYAVDRLGAVGWIRGDRLVYWGDLDVDGFGIVHRLRAHFPAARTAAMDAATLEAHLDLAVKAGEPAPEAPVPTSLTDAEARAFGLVSRGALRLEQERLPLPWVEARLREAVAAL